MEQMQFRKSSYSVGNPEQCVEVAFARDGVRVRDSKGSALNLLEVGPDAWAAFLRSSRSSA
ncbi:MULTISPECIES: DUF397 domain-containing protein [Lentzea]|uniref:DUF397 domain-containing protein n=1 Tax=Lentzea TaxID=165301 RepID=UPI0004C41E42|nr:DUF397 domain-containing protein [Lentzea aerocolonigenes]MCP2244648.1 protein of unknown function (DUF397) [Lentzea aerocolonigenes]